MKIFYLLSTFMFLWLFPVISFTNPFPFLKSTKLGQIEIHYPGSLCKLKNPLSQKEGQLLVLECFLEKGDKTPYRVYFSPGPSEDPVFIFHKKSGASWSELVTLPGKKLYILGNGSLFTSGHTNNMFDMRRKYQVSKGSIEEVLQPFYYVGIKSKTLRPAVLYRSQEMKEVIAQLPKNYAVEILLNQGEFYLVKTSFGLTGWLRLSGDQRESGLFSEIYFAGD